MKLTGTVRGRTIVFDNTLNLPDGQRVIADLHPVPTPEELAEYGIHPFPPAEYSVNNNMVNELRDELGI